MNLFRPDKMIVCKWLLHSSFYLFCGTAMAVREDRIETLLGLSILFVLGSSLTMI